MSRLFSTHPPIEERVRRLREMNVRPNFGSIDRPDYDLTDGSDRPNF